MKVDEPHETRTRPNPPRSEEFDDTPLRVAICSPDYPPDPKGTGIGTYSKLLAEGLAARGHHVHVLTRGNGIDHIEDSENITMHRFQVDRPDVPLKLSSLRLVGLTARSTWSEVRYRTLLRRKIRELIDDRAVQLVEAADCQADTYLYRSHDYPSVPYVIRLHTPLSVGELYDENLPEVGRRVLRFFERNHILSASHLTAPSKNAADHIRDEMALGNRPVRVFPNPPPRHLQLDIHAEHARDHREEGLVLFVGRVCRYKGIDHLAAAIPKVLERSDKARFVIVGPDTATTGEHSSTVDMIRSTLSSEHLDKVEFTGHVPLDQVHTYYERASVCVFPSLFDNFPYTCLEAMAHGCAIVGSRNSGMLDMLDHGRAGLLYDPPDAQELADRISGLLERPELRVELGRAARKRAERLYGDDIVFDETIAFYRQAIRDSAHAQPGPVE